MTPPPTYRLDIGGVVRAADLARVLDEIAAEGGRPTEDVANDQTATSFCFGEDADAGLSPELEDALRRGAFAYRWFTPAQDGRPAQTALYDPAHRASAAFLMTEDGIAAHIEETDDLTVLAARQRWLQFHNAFPDLTVIQDMPLPDLLEDAATMIEDLIADWRAGELNADPTEIAALLRLAANDQRERT